MEVDDWEPEWLVEEGGFMLSDGPLPVSKRQQCKGLCKISYILLSNFCSYICYILFDIKYLILRRMC